nr:hypothetical protein [Tanacetum cinerariifolium]
RKHKPRRKQREATEVPHTELEAEKRVPTPSHDPLPSGGIAKIDTAEDHFLINETTQDQGRINDQDLFGVHNLDGDEVFMDVTTDELILAQTLMEIKAAKPKAKGVTIQDPSKFRATSPPQPSQPSQAKDKGKNIMATVDADRQLAEQIQAQEKEQLSIKERSKLLAELIESKRKYSAAKRAEEIRNKPPTKAQQKKNVEEILKKTQAEVTKGSSKRAGQELEIVFEDDDDVAIKATPISSKSPTIVDYKIYREGKKSYFKIIRADKNSQNYITFGIMFKNFNKEDLEVLRSIVKERFKKTKPMDGMDNLLFQTLKTMFEHHVEDIIWKYQQGAVKVNNWKLIYSCRVYCITTKNMVYYLLVDKMYPFTNNILHQL